MTPMVRGKGRGHKFGLGCTVRLCLEKKKKSKNKRGCREIGMDRVGNEGEKKPY